MTNWVELFVRPRDGVELFPQFCWLEGGCHQEILADEAALNGEDCEWSGHCGCAYWRVEVPADAFGAPMPEDAFFTARPKLAKGDYTVPPRPHWASAEEWAKIQFRAGRRFQYAENDVAP